ncbi:hypothetical protein DSO57_1023407 [Entomophthora muscae]|uniref:Uncharacterized protein n=1 Tax=Entomophthora muscae TaxID=34485 RepID=A0ACC2U1D4_9FUNG|nr:hypothetical protein DSO57_1023407 [Entomophthora muscae]
MDRFDHAHLKELAALYTSGFAPAKPAALPYKHLPTHAMKRWVSLEFHCRLNAWEREVLLPFKKGARFSTKHSLFFNTSDKCQTQHDIGNNTIPLYVRVSFYISSFQTLPTHPKYFRPPHSDHTRTSEIPTPKQLLLRMTFWKRSAPRLQNTVLS